VITDPVPRAAAKRADYDRSDALVAMPLPPAPTIRALGEAITAAMAAGEAAPVGETSAALLGTLAEFYKCPCHPCACWACGPTR